MILCKFCVHIYALSANLSLYRSFFFSMPSYVCMFYENILMIIFLSRGMEKKTAFVNISVLDTQCYVCPLNTAQDMGKFILNS